MYKIMLADDEGIVIDSLKFIIEKEFKDTCEVQYAKTGRSVIELAESFRPDVAVMDIQMPVNYYPNDDVNERPFLQWRSHANCLYTNYLDYYVYQMTPYDLHWLPKDKR